MAKKNPNEANLGVGAALGLCVGMSLGLLTDNIGLWLPLGLAMGTGIALLVSNATDKGDGDDTGKGEGGKR
ncbi:MAG: hypothetical protein HRU11_11150 [Parvularculaceae bacterium]|nr:hypothetical protein [Parvularculaceae bacterium]